MPWTVRKRGAKYRVVKKDTLQIAKNKTGTALDGGGHPTKASAMRQVQALYASEGRQSNSSLRGRKY